MENGYLIIFSSFYKAAYAQDILSDFNINSTIRRAPTQLSMSCSYALLLQDKKIDIEKISVLLRDYRIPYNSIYVVMSEKQENELKYTEKYKRLML